MPFSLVAVILKVLLVNLLAALNFANFFKNKKNVWKIKKYVKNVKNVTRMNLKKTFLHLCTTHGDSDVVSFHFYTVTQKKGTNFCVCTVV